MIIRVFKILKIKLKIRESNNRWGNFKDKKMNLIKLKLKKIMIFKKGNKKKKNNKKIIKLISILNMIMNKIKLKCLINHI
jgi:hypothetical protein